MLAGITTTGDCDSGNDTVILEQVASTNHGSTWTATVRIAVVGSDIVDVGAAWSGGVSVDGSCTTSGSTCTKISPGIRKKYQSVTYTVTNLEGEPLNPPVSITVQKP